MHSLHVTNIEMVCLSVKTSTTGKGQQILKSYFVKSTKATRPHLLRSSTMVWEEMGIETRLRIWK
jgi:hypothetical protein